MLLGLDPLLTPDPLHALASAGHCDRIAIVDANVPAAANARRLIRLFGTASAAVLRAILSLLPVDDFEPDPALVMAMVSDPAAMPEAVADFNRLLRGAGAGPPRAVPRQDFYALAREAFAVVATGERRLYGNLLVTEGGVR